MNLIMRPYFILLKYLIDILLIKLIMMHLTDILLCLDQKKKKKPIFISLTSVTVHTIYCQPPHLPLLPTFVDRTALQHVWLPVVVT